VSRAWGGQETAKANIADQLLVALLQCLTQVVEDSGTHFGVSLRFLGVETDDVAARLAARSPDRHFLDVERGLLTARAWDQHCHHWLVVGEDDIANLRIAAFAGAENVFDALRLQFRHRLSTDHPSVGANAHAGNAKALAQAPDNRQQRFHVGGIAGPDLRTDRPAFTIDHHPNNNLMQIRATLLGPAILPERLATPSVEHQGGGIEQHHRQIIEQTATAVEQGLFNQIFVASGSARSSCLIG